MTNEQVAFLRQATIVWDPSESGAPIVEPESLYKSGLKGMHTALQVVLRFASIQPGTYRIANRIKEHYKEAKVQADAEGRSIPIPQEDEIEFTLSAKHIDLLRHANTDALMYFGACGFNSRCPYGDLSCWQQTVAHVLGLPVYRDQNGSPLFSEQELERFTKLHHDMLVALPVFLAHARIETGEFVRFPSAAPVWEKLSQSRLLPRSTHRLLRVENKQLRLKGNW